MTPYVLGISAFVILLAVIVVGLVIGLSLVKLLDSAVPHGARTISAWRHRRSHAAHLGTPRHQAS